MSPGNQDTTVTKQKAQHRHHSPPVTDALLAEITHRIIIACDPERVILFGSHAYGKPRKDSDIDLFVVMNPRGPDETNHERIMAVRAAARIGLLPMDVVVRTPAEVETRLAMGDFFLREIWDRGKVLYRRDAP